MDTQIKNFGFTATQALALNNVLQEHGQFNLDELMSQLSSSGSKKSFLVFKHNKYFTVPVEKIAFFHVKFESSVITGLDGREYPANYSLDQIQHLVAGKQFFRVNRQYLVNFMAIKEVEHYFARKLLINLTFSTVDRMLVPKEKVRQFLDWMEHR